MTPQKASDSSFAGLHVLADDDPRWPNDVLAQARAACEGGARVVQLRCKHATDARALAWAEEIRRATREHGLRFVVNDRFDLAWLAEADAVHLGQDDLPPARVPLAAREHLSIGRSTHDTAQLAAAIHEDVAYVAFGPIYGTASKSSPWSARGVEALASAVRRIAPRPIVAIGGIDVARVSEVARRGVAGVAVISAVAAAHDPVAAVRALARAFDEARTG